MRKRAYLKLGADTRDVLWIAQDGLCWICGCQMHKRGTNDPRSASLDHVWPKGQYGTVGDIGVTLLACRQCNGKRGSPMPSDREIRTLVDTWKRVDRHWLRWNISVMEADLAAMEAKRLRIAILRELEAA